MDTAQRAASTAVLEQQLDEIAVDLLSAIGLGGELTTTAPVRARMGAAAPRLKAGGRTEHCTTARCLQGVK